MRRTAPRASSTETSISDATISICSPSSSVRPCAASTASSTVGGSWRTRRRPSFVSQMSLMSFLNCHGPSADDYPRFTAMQQENCALHSQEFQAIMYLTYRAMRYIFHGVNKDCRRYEHHG